MSLFDGGFWMIVIFCIAIIANAYWLVRDPHTKKVPIVQSESHEEEANIGGWKPEPEGYPLGMYGVDGPYGGPAPSPNVSFDVDITRVG